MNSASILFALALPAALFAVDGTIINQTTGKPQANVIVSLIQPGQAGMQTLGSVKSGPQGQFKIDKPTEGPALIQAVYGGVPYNKMIPPGAPSTGIEVNVFESTSKAGTASMSQHMVLLQPSEKGLQVNEMYLMRNSTKETYNDTAKGTLQFYLTPGHGGVQVTVNAPGGMPVRRAAEPAGAADVFKVTYPLRPGETRFDLIYSVDTESKEFAGKVLSKGPTRLVVPNGVTLEGDGLEPLGAEPTTQARIYGVKSDTYKVKVAGAGSLALGEPGGAAGANAEDTGQPQIQESKPRIYDQLYVVLGLSLAILALGFAVLYRSRAPESRK